MLLAKLIGFDSGVNPEAKEVGMEYRTLEELLQEADIVSLHLPLNDSTRGIIGEKELALMKDTAVLINTARGPVVDNVALAKALEDGVIAGAGIDFLMANHHFLLIIHGERTKCCLNSTLPS